MAERQVADHAVRDALQIHELEKVLRTRTEKFLLARDKRCRHGLGGEAATGAAMAAEDGYVLAREMLEDDIPVQARLMKYSQLRYARNAFVYTFAYQWMLDEQSVRTPEDLAAMRLELAKNGSARIAASDRILNSRVI